MSVLQSKKYHILILILGFAVFVAFKWNDMFLPYFWDEMAGYMSGVVYMEDHGISLMPSAVPPDLSYGHPLFMHTFMATVAKIFGNTPFVMHATTMCFTFILALGTYFLALQLGAKPLTALMAYIILLFQPVIVAQSTQVLLEVFLAVHTVFAILFYLRQKYLISAIFTIMAVLTKETGLVLAIALFMQVMIDFYFERDMRKFTLKFALFDLPFLIFAAFLIIQKQTYGWYLNPVNVGKSNLEISSIVQKFWDYSMQFSLYDQGRIAFTLVGAAALFSYLRRPDFKIGQFHPIKLLLPIFLCGFVLFSSIADSHERYYVTLIPFLSILFAASIHEVSRRSLKFAPLILILCLNGNILNMDNGKRYRDSDLSYRKMVETNRQIINFVNSGQFEKDSISVVFPLRLAPLDSRYGYFKERHFIPDTVFAETAKYKIYSSPGNLDWDAPDTNLYKRIIRFESGYSCSELYMRTED